ncbi:hypothetical protein LA080_006012 [Diaporthe eres]|nr:hypothetical protein LA080_006012 [Diaporthe eres]
MDHRNHLTPFNDDLLSFALAAVPKVETVVARSMTNEPDTDAFLCLLKPLLADVRTHLGNRSSSRKNVLMILDALEVMVNWPKLPGSKPNLNKSFRPENSETLRKGLDSNPQQTVAKINIRKLASGKDEDAQEARRKFRKMFENFSKPQQHPHSRKKPQNPCEKFPRIKCEQRRPPRGPTLAELLVSDAKPARQDEHPECLRLLHKTLCHCLHVKNHEELYTANIGLAQFQRRSEANEGANHELPFDCFFHHWHPNLTGHTNMWKEYQIRVFLKSQQTKAPHVGEYHGPDSTKCTVSAQQFHDLLCRKVLERHVFSLGSDGLVFKCTEDLNPSFRLNAPSISLAALLGQIQLKGDYQLKLLLSYLLAKAVYQFFASAWMTPHWTKDVIHFMRQKLDMLSKRQEVVISIHKPCFTTTVRPPSQHHRSQSKEITQDSEFRQEFPPNTHPHPKVLALGILLLEMELGQGIEKHYEYGIRMVNQDYATAGRILNSLLKKGGRFDAVREIIEIYVKGHTDKFGTNKSSARAGVSEWVVEPLQMLFKRAWQEPESFDCNPVYFRSEELTHAHAPRPPQAAQDDVL